jgi:hypothetical protein
MPVIAGPQALSLAHDPLHRAIAAEHALAEAEALIEELHAQLDRANAATARVASRLVDAGRAFAYRGRA